MAEAGMQSTANKLDAPLTDEQAHAQSHFIKNFGNASLYLVLLPGFILIVTGMLDLVNHEWPPHWLLSVGFAGATITGLLAMLYFVVLTTVIWKRTGLKWYLVGEDSIGFYLLLIAFFFVLYWAVSSLEATYGITRYIILAVGTIIFLWLSRSSLAKRLSHQRQMEQSRYAAHWLKLGKLSFADILFLRIPSSKPM